MEPSNQFGQLRTLSRLVRGHLDIEVDNSSFVGIEVPSLHNQRSREGSHWVPSTIRKSPDGWAVS